MPLPLGARQVILVMSAGHILIQKLIATHGQFCNLKSLKQTVFGSGTCSCHSLEQTCFRSISLGT